MRGLFLGCWRLPSCCVSTWLGERGLLFHVSYDVPVPLMKPLPSGPDHLPKASFPNIITIVFDIWVLQRHRHLVRRTLFWEMLLSFTVVIWIFRQTILPFFFLFVLSYFSFFVPLFLLSCLLWVNGKKKIIADDLLALCLYLFMFFFSGFFGDYNTRKFLVYLESVFYHFL